MKKIITSVTLLTIFVLLGIYLFNKSPKDDLRTDLIKSYNHSEISFNGKSKVEIKLKEEGKNIKKEALQVFNKTSDLNLLENDVYLRIGNKEFSVLTVASPFGGYDVYVDTKSGLVTALGQVAGSFENGGTFYYVKKSEGGIESIFSFTLKDSLFKEVPGSKLLKDETYNMGSDFMETEFILTLSKINIKYKNTESVVIEKVLSV